jgi:hypothetical protein
MRFVSVLSCPGRDLRSSPEAGRAPDYRVGNAFDLGVRCGGLAGLKGGPCYVPLQQVHRTAVMVGQVGQLMHEQALTRPGYAGEKDDSPSGQL